MPARCAGSALSRLFVHVFEVSADHTALNSDSVASLLGEGVRHNPGASPMPSFPPSFDAVRAAFRTLSGVEARAPSGSGCFRLIVKPFVRI